MCANQILGGFRSTSPSLSPITNTIAGGQKWSVRDRVHRALRRCIPAAALCSARMASTRLTAVCTTCLLLMNLVAAEGRASSSSPSKLAKPATQKGNQPNAPSQNPPASSTNAQASKDSGFELSLASTVLNSSTEPDDHVRCFFTVKQLMDLRPVASVPVLTEADQSRVLTDVIAAVSKASDKDLTQQQKRIFVDTLINKVDGKLVGKTPGEALATIMNVLYNITAPASSVYADASDCDKLLNSLPQYGGNRQAQAVARDNRSFWCKSHDAAATSNALASVVKTSDPDLADTLLLGGTGPSGTASLNESVASSARVSLNNFARPTDIGCAYQILSWNEARLLFGRSVADDFIAIQVTVRNLNAKEEFIVHNAMLCVDGDIHAPSCQYFEGVDKIGVEAYNNAGESLTTRGIIVNSLAAASTILSVIQPMVNITNFSNAVAAFSGGAVPGFNKIVPDHQKEQLLMIANNGFTATYNTKTVVGKSGAATFYTWFPVKPFLQGWWLQECAKNVMSVNSSPDDANMTANQSGAGSSKPSSGTLGTKESDSNSPQTPMPARQPGIDYHRAQESCQNLKGTQFAQVAYKDWSPIADQLFRQLSLAVVAGIHVLEDTKNQSLVASIDCPKTAEGNMDLAKAGADGTISCNLTGTNLDKVNKLRLENAANVVDPNRPEAVVTVSGDNTTGTAKFKASDLAAASGDSYNVFAVGKDGNETATGQKINLDSGANISKVDPPSLDLANPGKITLNGNRLDKIAKVCFSNAATASGGKNVAVTPGSGTQATLSFDINNSLQLTTGSWHVFPGECANQPAANAPAVTITASAAQIDSFTPTKAAVGATITLAGSNFGGTTAVTIGGVTVPKDNFKLTDAKTITAKVPTGAKSGVVMLNGPGGKEASKGGFVLAATPNTKKTTTP